MPNVIRELYANGQSVWCDHLSRRLLATAAATPADSGPCPLEENLQRLTDVGVVGVTSNPTIFMKAITGSRDYDGRIGELLAEDGLVPSIYEDLVLTDIADAADMLRPVFERTKGIDGYVSLEVNPNLAYDTDATIGEARRLFGELDRLADGGTPATGGELRSMRWSNVFIKVPATQEGLPAIETLIGEGINVNVTLVFSIAMYEKVMAAYIDGLKRLDGAGGDVARVASVASFFISRVDTLVDKLLLENKAAGADVGDLFGRAAVANARLAYRRFEEMFNGNATFRDLAAKGARVQRPLWASTSTKNPEFCDTKYVDELVGPDTVNTMPPHTIAAVLDHGQSEVTIRDGLAEARSLFDRLAKLGIDFDAVTSKLTVSGVAAFVQSFEELHSALESKRRRLRAVH